MSKEEVWLTSNKRGEKQEVAGGGGAGRRYAMP